MKVTSILTACFILIFGLVTSVGAISYTDARFDTEIEYSLILNSVTDFTYNFTFTIAPTGGGTGTWYADWFAIKFDGRDGTIGTPTLGSWEYWDKNNDEKLWGGKNYTVGRPEGGFIGFYLSLLDNDIPDDESTGYTGGVQVTGSSLSESFAFNVILPGALTDPNLIFSFQVGYYGTEAGKSEKIQTDRLSAVLVPEPSTLILLGAGLVGLGIWGRKRFKARG